jgi:hypothetical protein
MKTFITLPLVAALAGGCSMFVPPKQTVSIKCVQPHAEVKIAGEPHPLPLEIQVPRNRDLFLECSAVGYTNQFRTIETHLNGYGGLDTVGFLFWLVPGLGLACPGSHSLDAEEITFDLSVPYVKPAIKQTQPVTLRGR